jgi:hypothetical protein
LKNESFSHHFHKKKRLFFVNRNDTHWVIGHESGVVQTVEDTSLFKRRYWGIACSSLKPVKLTYWKHIGRSIIRMSLLLFFLCWCCVLRWIWCLWCYSECISTPGELDLTA